jgi:predicted nucleic acid-binding protein
MIKRGCLKPLINVTTLDLAVYETLNTVWKERVVLKRIDEETAKQLVRILERTFKIIALDKVRDPNGVFELACKESITIYDASYLYYALQNKLTLVTDDEKLLEKARQYINVIKSRDLAQRYGC